VYCNIKGKSTGKRKLKRGTRGTLKQIVVYFLSLAEKKPGKKSKN
jgi:hypothetical protein